MNISHIRHALVAMVLSMASTAATAQTGTWTVYPSYSDITSVVKGGDVLYAVASGSLLSYNANDGSVTTYDRTNVLNDSHVSLIAWCASAARLIVVYDNSNIDLLNENGTTVNLSDIYSTTMTADKTVNDIYVNGATAYLSTGFGIVRMNVKEGYINDSYILGFNVDHSYIEGDHIYAASPSEGLYSARMSSNLLDKSSWSRVGEYSAKDRTIDTDMLSTIKPFVPNGPTYDKFYSMAFNEKTLYAVPGLYVAGESDAYTQGSVDMMSASGEWTAFEDDLNMKTGYVYIDNNCVAIDPTNPKRVFVGGRCGLYEFEDGKLKQAYNQQNSPLCGAVSGNTILGNDYTIVSGITFDTEGNLWILNSLAKGSNIIELKKDGTFVTHCQQKLLFDGVSPYNLTRPFFDSRGILWFVNDIYTQMMLVSYNPSTDETTIYESPFINEDGASVNTRPRCVAEDLSGNIWLGTVNGPLMLSRSQINSGGTEFYQPKVPRNDGTNLADYLLNGVDVTAIAVDGGGRLWMGTTGLGVYLIDSDGTTQLQHFTKSDTPLLSDNISCICIDGDAGRVFFGSMDGLCSYQSDATTPSDKMDGDNVWAYPNPVTPDYTGNVTITGLSLNADVKILTTSGAIVVEGKSNGGMFTWDCTDKKGKRVASGVYFVATATAEGKSGTVCKIAVVN